MNDVSLESGLPSFKEHIFQGIPFSGSFLSKYHICNTEYVEI